jgi:hypothetical protein
MRFALFLIVALGVAAEPQSKPKFKGPGLGMRKGGPIRPEAFDKFRNLSPEERKAALRNLPPERREMMERRLDQWERMSPEERQRLQGSYARFQEMPPEQQQNVRKLFRTFSETFTEDRRPQAHGMIRRLKKSTPEERKRIVESKRFRENFNEDERKLIEQMVDELPDRE